jgi:hypothetical protein
VSEGLQGPSFALSYRASEFLQVGFSHPRENSLLSHGASHVIRASRARVERVQHRALAHRRHLHSRSNARRRFDSMRSARCSNDARGASHVFCAQLVERQRFLVRESASRKNKTHRALRGDRDALQKRYDG